MLSINKKDQAKWWYWKSRKALVILIIIIKKERWEKMERLTKEEKRYIKIGKITENIILGLLLCLAYLIPIFVWFAK